ncbi:inter-alpha-trypsin inhibitor heavy chain H6 [Trichomycterus rosablanca]|uniref:inter-alpha-trypsin inhibitor heavy chain H6 n=1 Tax=Trichomycterus rosablanca TaxID=2290929 RepID=UPI002F356F66
MSYMLELKSWSTVWEIVQGLFTTLRLRRQSNTAKLALKITDYHVRCRVISRYALTTVQSTVWNQLHYTKEAAFEVDLPSSAFISNFTITSNGIVHVAEVKERAAARKIYDDAKKNRRTTGLVATKEREIEKFRVAVSIPPGTHMSFSLTYEELLTRRQGRYELRLGLRPEQPVQNLTVDVTIAERTGISFIKVLPLRISRLLTNTAQAGSEAPPSTQVQQDQHCAHIHYRPTLQQQKNMSPKGINADFIIQYDVEQKDLMGDIQVKDGYFVHYFSPRDLPVISKDVVFVIDISGSMIGTKIKQTKAAISTILSDLREGDYFNLITFSDKVQIWKKDRTVLATKQNIRDAKEFVRKIVAEGWTNINAALLSAAQLINAPLSSADHKFRAQRVPMIIFLTDGEATIGVTAQEVILRNAQNALGSASLFGLAFGDDADFPLLKRLALENRGMARMVYEDDDATLQLKGFYDEVASPLLSDIQLSYMKDQAYDVSLALFPNYFQGSELVVTGKLKTDVQDLKVSLMAKDSKNKVKVESKVTLVKADGNETTLQGCTGELDGISNFIHRLWAYYTIKELLIAKLNSTDPFAQRLLGEKATNLSLKYNFVTPVTSLVVVKPDIDESAPTAPSSTTTTNKPIITTTESVTTTATQTSSVNPKTISNAETGGKKSNSVLLPKSGKPLMKPLQPNPPPSNLHTTGHQASKDVKPVSTKRTPTLLPNISNNSTSFLSTETPKTMTTPSVLKSADPPMKKPVSSSNSKNSTTPNDPVSQPDFQEVPSPDDMGSDINVALDFSTHLAATFGPMLFMTDAPMPREASGILDVLTAIQFEDADHDKEYDVPYDYDYSIHYDSSSLDDTNIISSVGTFSSSVDGDPHFVVKLPKLKENLCFTVDGEPDDVLQLLEDPINGITVNAHLMLGPPKLGLEDRTRTFFDSITIKTGKADIRVTVTMDSVVVKGEGFETLPTNQKGSVIHPGLKIVLDGHQNCWIELNKNVLFLVLFHHYVHPSYFQMEHLGFYIADGKGLSSHTKGLLGQFQHSTVDVMRIKNRYGTAFHHAQISTNSLALGLLRKGDEQIPTTLQDKILKDTLGKRHSALCWVVPKVEVERLLGQPYQSYVVDSL